MKSLGLLDFFFFFLIYLCLCLTTDLFVVSFVLFFLMNDAFIFHIISLCCMALISLEICIKMKAGDFQSACGYMMVD